MATDPIEHALRDALHARLDRETGPHPAWAGSPAARRVAARPRRAPLRLLAVAALVGAGIGVTLMLGAPRQPVVRSNGWVAYAAIDEDQGGDPDTDIWFAAPGRDPRRVVGTDDDVDDQACPAFSPDGRRLAYGRVQGLWSQTASDVPRWPDYREAAVVVAEVAEDGSLGAEQRFVVGDGVALPCPIWSPSGDRLAFGVPLTSPINPQRSGEGSEVWILRPADGDIVVIPDILAMDLEWSPDGSILAIDGGTEAVDVELRDRRIQLYDLAAGSLRSLDETAGNGGLTWSPDGRRLAYDYDGLHVVDMRTGANEVVTRGYRSLHGIGPLWSPDGMTIAYQRVISFSGERHEVVLVTPDAVSEETGRAREVVLPVERRTTDGRILPLYPWRIAWSPSGDHLLYVAWTYPDGGAEVSWILSVPIDPTAAVEVLATNPLSYDSPDSMAAQFQVWQSKP